MSDGVKFVMAGAFSGVARLEQWPNTQHVQVAVGWSDWQTNYDWGLLLPGSKMGPILVTEMSLRKVWSVN